MPPCGPHSVYDSHSQHTQGMHTGGSSQTWIQGAYGGCERHGRLEHEGPPFNQHCDSPCIPVCSTNTNMHTAVVVVGIIGTTGISTPAGETRVMHVPFPLILCYTQNLHEELQCIQIHRSTTSKINLVHPLLNSQTDL